MMLNVELISCQYNRLWFCTYIQHIDTENDNCKFIFSCLESRCFYEL